jgi:dihydrofolate synthase/folylpolyglutamate synthase
MNAPVSFADREYRCNLGEIDNVTGLRQYMLYDLQSHDRRRGVTPLGGLAQQKNIQTAASAVAKLAPGFGLDEAHFERGVADVVRNTGLMGRWQILSHSPLTICDTGHNREGLEYVVRQIKAVSRAKLHMVIGFVNDKDLSSILPLFPKEAYYYFTKASIPRAMDEKVLKAEAEKYDLHGTSHVSVAWAIESARLAADTDDMIFVGGSTFVVAEAL